MKKYTFEDNGLFLLYIPWHFPLNHNEVQGYSKEAEQKFENNYPAIFKYLSIHKNKLSARNQVETNIRYEWYALQRFGSKYMDDFSKQKIIWKRIGSILRFCYDDSGIYCLDSTCFASGSNPKYLTAFLNSKMGHYLMKDSPKTGTGDLLVSVQAINPIKVPIPSSRDINYLDSLVDKIIEDPDNMDRIEEKINAFFYKKYKLSADEILTVETKLSDLNL